MTDETLLDISRQEERLMADPASLLNTIGPMALPLVFLLLPVLVAIAGGLILNAVYNNQPPLIAGNISPAWLWLVILYPLEGYYWLNKGEEAWKVKWLSWRYWMGERHIDNDFKLRYWKFMGKAEEKIALKKGETAPRKMVGITGTSIGFVEKPKDERAGDLVYEFWLNSKNFPLAIVFMRDVPERLLSFTGNRQLVQNGGLLFTTENIAAVSFVRTDFTKTDEIPFVPVGVFSDYSHRAIEIRDNLTETLPEAAVQAALVRDNFHASQFRREAIDERKLRELVEKQERDMDREVDRRVGEVLKRKQKGEAGLVKGKGSKIVNDWGGLIIITAIIAGVILVLALRH